MVIEVKDATRLDRPLRRTRRRRRYHPHPEIPFDHERVPGGAASAIRWLLKHPHPWSRKGPRKSPGTPCAIDELGEVKLGRHRRIVAHEIAQRTGKERGSVSSAICNARRAGPRSTASSYAFRRQGVELIAEGKYGEMSATRITGAQRAHRDAVHRIKLVQPTARWFRPAATWGSAFGIASSSLRRELGI